MTEEQIEKLADFARACIRGAFNASIDGSDVQDMLEKYGLIEEVPYDPDVHGDDVGDELEVSPGENIYQTVSWLKGES